MGKLKDTTDDITGWDKFLAGQNNSVQQPSDSTRWDKYLNGNQNSGQMGQSARPPQSLQAGQLTYPTDPFSNSADINKQSLQGIGNNVLKMLNWSPITGDTSSAPLNVMALGGMPFGGGPVAGGWKMPPQPNMPMKDLEENAASPLNYLGGAPGELMRGGLEASGLEKMLSKFGNKVAGVPAAALKQFHDNPLENYKLPVAQGNSPEQLASTINSMTGTNRAWSRAAFDSPVLKADPETPFSLKDKVIDPVKKLVNSNADLITDDPKNTVNRFLSVAQNVKTKEDLQNLHYKWITSSADIPKPIQNAMDNMFDTKTKDIISQAWDKENIQNQMNIRSAMLEGRWSDAENRLLPKDTYIKMQLGAAATGRDMIRSGQRALEGLNSDTKTPFLDGRNSDIKTPFLDGINKFQNIVKDDIQVPHSDLGAVSFPTVFPAVQQQVQKGVFEDLLVKHTEDGKDLNLNSMLKEYDALPAGTKNYLEKDAGIAKALNSQDGILRTRAALPLDKDGKLPWINPQGVSGQDLLKNIMWETATTGLGSALGAAAGHPMMGASAGATVMAGPLLKGLAGTRSAKVGDMISNSMFPRLQKAVSQLSLAGPPLYNGLQRSVNQANSDTASPDVFAPSNARGFVIPKDSPGGFVVPR